MTKTHKMILASAGLRKVQVEHREFNAAVAQLAEHVLGKDEVTGSRPVSSSTSERSQPH